MNVTRHSLVMLALGLAGVIGCGERTVDFSKIHRPARSMEMSAFDVFVGSWNWQAEMLNGDAAHKSWTGTANWQWTLDQQCLHGQLSAKSGDVAFDTAGIWTWDAKSKKYIWWMFNNWGYPQQGTAKYDGATKSWTLKYSGTGLDGTSSTGEYRITVVDSNTLNWEMTEWASMHMAKKIEMKGTYTRKK